MKKLFTLAFVLTVAFSAFGQKQKSKDDLYKEIGTLTNTKKQDDMAKAYPMAKEYLERFGKDDKDEKLKFISMFVTRYREHQFNVALDAHKYAEGFALGREILAAQPDNVDVNMNLAYSGYDAMSLKGDKTYLDESLGYAKKTIQMMEAGTMPARFAPFTDKDEASALMYFVVGNLMLDKDKKEAAHNLYKATAFESRIKNNSATYYLIATCYEDQYTKFAAEMKSKADKKMSDAEYDAAAARGSSIVDGMMDAYARAVKRAETDKNADAVQWKLRLAQIYKFTRKTEDGLPEYINQVVTTPMRDPGK